jgi:hypothetical protein
MWIRSEFGVLCNLEQASEVTISNGTVQAHFGGEVRPLSHHANETEALKTFDRIAQALSEGKGFLDLSKRALGNAPVLP